jgi:DNA-binding CsgD family transcriptional regulator
MRALDLARLVAPLFGAATATIPWSEALLPMAHALGAHHHSLWTRSSRNLLLRYRVACSVPTEAADRYTEHYGVLDPLAPRAVALPLGTIFSSDDLMPFDRLRRSSYYNEWMGFYEMRRFIGSACSLPSTEEFVAIAFQRPPGSEPFDADDRELMSAIVPQLRAATEVWSRVRDVQERMHDLERLVDGVTIGMALLGPDGRVRFHNRSLAEIIARRNGFSIGADGLLQCGSPSDTDRLYAAARRVAHTGLATTLEISRPSDRRPYRVVMIPVEGGATLPGKAVLVRVHDPAQQDRDTERRLRERFDLTPAEAQVTVRLAQGQALSAVAAGTGRSLATARNLIKRAFSKTDTHRQAALVALVHALENDTR